jgi:hypothetical protein
MQRLLHPQVVDAGATDGMVAALSIGLLENWKMVEQVVCHLSRKYRPD